MASNTSNGWYSTDLEQCAAVKNGQYAECPHTIECNYRPDYTLISPSEYNEVYIARNQTGSTEDADGDPATGKFMHSSSDGLERRLVSITGVRKLACSWKNVYLLSLDAASNYIPGDAIGILAPNSDALVNRLMAVCGFENYMCRIERSGRDPFCFGGYLADFFKHMYDLTGLPKKIHLLRLARTSDMHERIEYLCSREGTLDYIKLAANWCSLIDIIEHFGCRPSLSDLIMNCECIKPRYYSLINSREDKYEILLGEMTKIVRGTKKRGHVSGFVKDVFANAFDEARAVDLPDGMYNKDIKKYKTAPEWQKKDGSMPIEMVYKKNILFRQSTTVDLICFCTGTGIAPFVSLYRNRNPKQRLCLVYGFRNDEDDLSLLFDINCRIVRAKSAIGSYVTDFVPVIGEYADACHIFVCGNMRMQRSIFQKIKETYPALVDGKRIFFDNWQ